MSVASASCDHDLRITNEMNNKQEQLSRHGHAGMAPSLYSIYDLVPHTSSFRVSRKGSTGRCTACTACAACLAALDRGLRLVIFLSSVDIECPNFRHQALHSSEVSYLTLRPDAVQVPTVQHRKSYILDACSPMDACSNQLHHCNILVLLVLQNGTRGQGVSASMGCCCPAEVHQS